MGDRTTILVIDDDASVRLITRRALESFGYRAILAEDGESGVLALGEQPALVLMDLSMPGMSGEATLRAINAGVPATPVVVMSGFDEETLPDYRAEGLIAGFLQKPFSLDGLRTALESAIG